MIKRKKIGSVNTESPTETIRRLFSWIVMKLIFCAVLSAVIYFFFNYFLINFINFMIEHIVLGSPIDKDNAYFLISMIFALIVVNYMVFRDRLRKR